MTDDGNDGAAATTNPFGGFSIALLDDSPPRRGPTTATGGPSRDRGGRRPRRGQGRDRRLRPGRADRRDLRGARQPRADRPRRLRAGRPADADQRRRELPGLPRRHPGAGPDGRDARAGGALRYAHRRRRHRSGRLLRAAVPAVGARHRIPCPGGDRRDRRLGAVARPRQRDPAARARRVGLRHVRRVLLPRPRDRRRRRRRHRVRGGDLPDPLRHEGAPAPPTRHLPGVEDHGRPRRSPIPRSRSIRTPRSRRSSATPRSTALRLRDTVTGAETKMPIDGLFIAIGYRPNTEAFRDWLEVDEAGYLVVHDETGSKIDGVFIAGDVHDHRYRQAVTAAGDGCKAAIDAERWLGGAGHHRGRDLHRLVSRPGRFALLPRCGIEPRSPTRQHRARRGDRPSHDRGLRRGALDPDARRRARRRLRPTSASAPIRDASIAPGIAPHDWSARTSTSRALALCPTLDEFAIVGPVRPDRVPEPSLDARPSSSLSSIRRPARGSPTLRRWLSTRRGIVATTANRRHPVRGGRLGRRSLARAAPSEPLAVRRHRPIAEASPARSGCVAAIPRVRPGSSQPVISRSRRRAISRRRWARSRNLAGSTGRLRGRRRPPLEICRYPPSPRPTPSIDLW